MGRDPCGDPARNDCIVGRAWEIPEVSLQMKEANPMGSVARREDETRYDTLRHKAKYGGIRSHTVRGFSSVAVP